MKQMARSGKVLIYGLITVFLIGCNEPEKDKKIQLTITNPSKTALTNQPIKIARENLKLGDSVNRFPFVIHENDTLPSQLNDLNGDGNSDELFFVMDFGSLESKILELKWVSEKPNYPIRTSARFGKRTSLDTPVQPETEEILYADQLPLSIGYQAYQTDGPSWENDKIGFRHYLDGRNSKDLFGKKYSMISPETVGVNEQGAVEDNYHVMEDWGRDILAVGNSVGLGGYCLITDNDELLRLGVTVTDSVNNVEKTTFNITSEGPLKSVLDYTYTDWKPTPERSYQVSEKTEIWPGIYGYKNTVSVNGLTGDENLGVGLVTINNDNPIHVLEENEKYVIIYTHDKQTYNKEWWLGMALILPKESYQGYINAPEEGSVSKTILAELKISNGTPLSYYAIAGWELSDPKFIDESYFKTYVTNVADMLSTELKIELN